MSKLKDFLLLKCLFPLGELVMGTCASRWLRQIARMEKWTPAKVKAWQDARLQAFLAHAYQHTAYYRQVFDSLGLKPEDIRTKEDLQKLPVITKETVNAHYEEFIPDNLSSFRYRLCRSGGTTGVPIQYYCDENVWGYVTAARIYHWRKTGYRYGDAFIALGSASLFSKAPSLPRRIYDKLRNEHPLNCVNMTDEVCEGYCEYIDKNRIHYIYGYAAAIYMFADYVRRTGAVLPEIKGVFTTSENLTDHYRETIEQVFRCRVMDCYGARDAGINAYEDGYHRYRIGYNAIVELVDAIEENEGSVVTTNILNYAFPLIRYRFGDEAELIPDDEVEGYNGQMLRRILGRSSHVLRLENGHHLTATGISMIMKEFDIKAFDIRKTGENQVLLRIQTIPGKYTDGQEAEIVKTFKRYLGDDCTLDIEYVAQFEPNANGKRTYFMV